MPGFVLESTLESRFLRRWSWRRLQPRWSWNRQCRGRSLRLYQRARRQDTFGSVEAGDGATIIGCGHEATGARQRTGAEMFIEAGTVTGAMDIVPNAMKVFTGTMVAANR